uniref:ATPase inhibitor, mitochondrial n=1 Tax=Blastobotrys adeninivorans TaxID=409370 RepID=A0A060T7T5_BLAAD
MLSRTTLRTLRTAPRLAVGRFYSEGDTGAPRSAQEGADAFRTREKAQEDYYIRQHEADKLKALREQLNAAKDHLERLDQEIQANEKRFNDAGKNGN